MSAPAINFPRIISVSGADGIARPRYIVYGLIWDEDLMEYRPVESHDVESIPAGGTTGQALVKASNADFDVEWDDVAGGPGGASAWGDITGTLADQTDLQAALDDKSGTLHHHDAAYEPLNANIQAHISSTSNPHSVTKAQVGLTNVDDTADASKPVSTLQQAALDLKAPLASPTFTGTVAGITKAMVGLANVDNTSDANKPVSTAQQTALDLKANLASPTFTGTVAGITKSMVGLGNVDNTSDANKPVSTATQTALDLKADLASPTFTGTVAGISKSMVGLGNVDNTSDANKPISTATQTALDAKEATANKNAANGYAGLSSGKLTGSQQVYGTGANTACEGNDSRLSDARTPTSHSITGAQHSFPGGTTTFLRADGAFAAPTAAAADPVYSPGSFTVVTETGRIVVAHLKLATTERATVQGTGRLVILG